MIKTIDQIFKDNDIIESDSIHYLDNKVITESDYTSELFEALRIENELITCENQLEVLMQMEDALQYTQGDETIKKNAWDHIKEFFKSLINSIKALLTKIWNFIQESLIGVDSAWYNKKSLYIKDGYDKVKDSIQLNLYDYKILDPFKKINDDIENLSEGMKKIFNNAINNIDKFLNDHNKEKKMEDIDFITYMNKNTKDYFPIEKYIDILNIKNIPNDKLNSNIIRAGILNRYFGTTEPQKIGKRFKELFDMTDFKKAFSAEYLNIIKSYVSLLKQNNFLCEEALYRVDKFLKDNPEKYKAATSSAKYLRLLLSTNTSTAMTLWNIYMKIRNDVKKCAHECLKFSKQKE